MYSRVHGVTFQQIAFFTLPNPFMEHEDVVKLFFFLWTSVVRLGYKRRKFLPYFMLPAGHISHNPAASAAAKWATNLSRVRAEMLATSWSL